MIKSTLGIILLIALFSSETVTQTPTFIPDRTESGLLKFTLNNINPVNIYRGLTQKDPIEFDGKIDPQKNCHDYNPKTKVCELCKTGYYLNENSEVKGFCSSCSSAISNCGECSSIRIKDKVVVKCSNCGFPQKPNRNQDACEARTVLLYYVIIYLIIAVILGVLTCMEKTDSD